MIIRERIDSFVMIDQHHHASISGELFEQIASYFSLCTLPHYEAIRYAIYYHDVGWNPFDASPLWNDAKQEPLSFISYPNSIKSVLYQNGIDNVQANNIYAALLCSEHYVRFLANDVGTHSKNFMQHEQERQATMKQSLEDYKEQDFIQHYELLQFFDNLSLYVCLHELDASLEDTHFFFKHGIALPTLFGGETLQLAWEDNQIILHTPLLAEPISITLAQKVVPKEYIHSVGLLEAWNNTETELVPITMLNKTT